MNQWTNSDKDPRAQDAYGAPPWVEQKRTAERVGKKKSGSRGGVVALAIALVAALLVAFGAGFGSVYGLEKLADEYAYVFRRSSNPTFTKPKDEQDKEESVPSPEEPSEPKAPDMPKERDIAPDEPDASGSEASTGTFTESGNIEIPAKGVPRMALESSAGLRKLNASDLVEKLTPSVVSVIAYVSQSETDGYILGTGTIYSSDGYLITNHHVIEKAVRVVVRLYDETEYEAAYICSDETADIAVLKIDAQGLTPARFGSPSDLSVGDEVTCIGTPASLEFAGTATFGHIAGPERYLPMDSAGNVMRLIQTDASINPGNSGGPLVNAYGQVVGIIIAKLNATTYEGIGFAIPADQIEHVVSDLLDYGFVTGYPMLGFTGTTVGEGKTDGNNPEGVLVAEVHSTSNAYGILQAGDVVFSVNGQTVRSIPDINAIKGRLKVGDTMHLGVYRDGETFEADIVLRDRHEVE